MELIKEFKQFLELYSAYQLEYDYFDHKNMATFSYFIVNINILVDIIIGKI